MVRHRLDSSTARPVLAHIEGLLIASGLLLLTHCGAGVTAGSCPPYSSYFSPLRTCVVATNCTNGVTPVCADLTTLSGYLCSSGLCVYRRKATAACVCVEGEARPCSMPGTGCVGYQKCIASSSTAANWNSCTLLDCTVAQNAEQEAACARMARPSSQPGEGAFGSVSTTL